MKRAWGLDGAGHLLPQCVDLLLKLETIDLYLSRSAEEVLSFYGLKEAILNAERISVVRREGITFAHAGRFARGEYNTLVLAPASSNSVAKFVCGISDSLTTNLFAAAGKSRTRAIVLPTDTESEVDSLSPSGWVKVYPRRIDLENVEKLKRFENVIVARNVEELERILR